jgi:hypothetical protein
MTVKATTASTMMTMTVAQAMTMMTNTVGGERYDHDERDNAPGLLRFGYGWGLSAGAHIDNALSNCRTGACCKRCACTWRIFFSRASARAALRVKLSPPDLPERRRFFSRASARAALRVKLSPPDLPKRLAIDL